MKGFKIVNEMVCYTLLLIFTAVAGARAFCTNNFLALTAYILAGVAYMSLIALVGQMRKMQEHIREQHEFIKEVCEPVIRTIERQRIKKEGQSSAPLDDQSSG